jgi:hypothetical protein
MLVFGCDKLAVRPIRCATKADALPRSIRKTVKKIAVNARIREFRLKKNPHQPLRLMRVLIGGPNHG